jgi:hypothetical protein
MIKVLFSVKISTVVKLKNISDEREFPYFLFMIKYNDQEIIKMLEGPGRPLNLLKKMLIVTTPAAKGRTPLERGILLNSN